MQRVLLITVRFHDGRYHGTGDWPPSPARLFQALVAAIGQDGPLSDDASTPLEWLETLAPPLIAAPLMVEGRAVTNYVPNNDLDAVGGDSHRIGSIRTAKPWKPKLFDRQAAFLYAWCFDEAPDSLLQARRVCGYAERLYQLGRGIDQAWAVGEVTELQKLEELLLAYRGMIRRPAGGRHGTVLDRPQPGSLKSLKDRYEAMSRRFKAQGQGRSVNLQFAQAPKPRFTPTAYDSPPRRQVFEIHSPTSQADLIAWPLSRMSALVETIRDAAVQKLKAALSDQESQIEQCVVGRRVNGGTDAPKAARVRILPLPSIGHEHADHAIRRVLIEVPSGCLLRSDDVIWSFSGLELSGSDSANRPASVLTTTGDDTMLRHYGVGDREYARWRTVTPAALPETAKRRRIEPTRRSAEAKPGTERAAEQQRAAGEVIQALRHAEIPANVDAIRVQREPFEANGKRVEGFAPGTRFQKERLWHVELLLREPVTGPLIIGDGRYCGLGLMAPVRQGDDATG
jgi:CRISPR-associated protein Csb2